MSNTRNYIGATVGATSYEQALIYARRDMEPYYNQTNCYQAKADLAHMIDAVQKDKLNPNPTTIQKAYLVEMQNVVTYLTNWVAQRCQEATPTPPPVVVLPPPAPSETPDDNYEMPLPTETGSNKMIWIAGAALIGFIIWNNKKKKRKN